jgi:hypothetical protein
VVLTVLLYSYSVGKLTTNTNTSSSLLLALLFIGAYVDSSRVIDVKLRLVV